MVGCLLDLDDHTISFIINGELFVDLSGNEAAFEGVVAEAEGFVPACTPGDGQTARIFIPGYPFVEVSHNERSSRNPRAFLRVRKLFYLSFCLSSKIILHVSCVGTLPGLSLSIATAISPFSYRSPTPTACWKLFKIQAMKFLLLAPNYPESLRA